MEIIKFTMSFALQALDFARAKWPTEIAENKFGWRVLCSTDGKDDFMSNESLSLYFADGGETYAAKIGAVEVHSYKGTIEFPIYEGERDAAFAASERLYTVFKAKVAEEFLASNGIL